VSFVCIQPLGWLSGFTSLKAEIIARCLRERNQPSKLSEQGELGGAFGSV